MRRQLLNEDVFKASVLRFFIASFKRFYDEYLVGFFLTLSIEPLCENTANWKSLLTFG